MKSHIQLSSIFTLAILFCQTILATSFEMASYEGSEISLVIPEKDVDCLRKESFEQRLIGSLSALCDPPFSRVLRE